MSWIPWAQYGAYEKPELDLMLWLRYQNLNWCQPYHIISHIPLQWRFNQFSYYLLHQWQMIMASSYLDKKGALLTLLIKSTGHHPTQLCFSLDSFPDISLPIMTIHVTTAKPWSPNMTPIIIFMEWGNGSMIFDTASGNIVYIYIIYDNYWLWLYGGIAVGIVALWRVVIVP